MIMVSPQAAGVHKLASSVVAGAPLVVVIIGSTSIIAQHTLSMLTALLALSTSSVTTAAAGTGSRFYLVGRNARATEEILAAGRLTCPGARWTFVQAQNLALLRDVWAACKDVTRLEEDNHGDDARVDYLMLTMGGPVFQPRTGKPSSFFLFFFFFFSRPVMGTETSRLQYWCSPWDDEPVSRFPRLRGLFPTSS